MIQNKHPALLVCNPEMTGVPCISARLRAVMMPTLLSLVALQVIVMWCHQSQQSWHQDNSCFSVYFTLQHITDIFSFYFIKIYFLSIYISNQSSMPIISKLISFSEMPHTYNPSQEICTLFVLCSVSLWFGLTACIQCRWSHEGGPVLIPGFAII